ncbi:tRNA1(Val) (adenine(37)-N6)-methyltransferase [Paenibacillus tarimensis]|uniref:tRNA1(Val) (adenine(37)-N6)-methyltransferase n=1 Tax=Paenibacillus tarimensis TaxID=416012 RepID=UPI001F3D11BB|nr:tRNA1(Val) (adenine(37)-N6)-methyltransferase [Paenibacillus tarimensis]MCF2946238.1 tRNA1(Val) (adenine(37)-N6)-methyltransferase [Paenibacillus tarimensis]
MSEPPIELQPSERLDDLLTHNLHIIQSPEVFSFSMDAVLLARFAHIPMRGRVLDLCSGNGVIPLLMSTRTNASIDAVELQPRLADMARRSIKLNGLQDRLTVHEGDLRTYHLSSGYGVYDAVTVNPPYMPAHTGDANVNSHYAIARHEIHCTLEDVVTACARLVKSGGKVAMVHRPTRLAEIITYMKQVKLEPKRIRFVHPYLGSEANMVLIEAMRDARPEVKILQPLIVYKENKQYHDELMEIYYGTANVGKKEVGE